MNHLSEIQRDLLVEGLDDYVGLWQVARAVRREAPHYTNDNVRERSLKELGLLLHAGYIKPGQLTEDGGFLEWQLGPAESLKRIDSEWRELGHDPNIYQICWFSNTNEGDEAAQAEMCQK
ncbi:MAG: hypothetical protein GY722_29645 [bacterium]|nr:hypothetical protein [bacterium]